MTAYLAEHPALAKGLLDILDELRTRGYAPVPMHRVKQPFDYGRR